MNGNKLIKRRPRLWRTDIALILCLLSIGAIARAQNNPAQLAGVSVMIRYYNQVIYFPNSDIEVKVTIANNSGNTYRFELADNRMYNLDFDVRTLTNIEVSRSTKFTTQMNSNQPVYFRDVSIDPGEEFSFVVHLQDYRGIVDPGMYVVTATFYPNLRGNGTGTSSSSTSISSNRLTLSVRPSVTGLTAIKEQIDQQTGEVLSREALPPDQVVAFTLQARQKGNWNRFFLYLDVPSLLKRDPARERRFIRMSQADQQAYLQQFRHQLEQPTTASDISVIPTSFQIVRTSYTPDRGTVEVLEKFNNGSYTTVKRYTYTLERRDNIWFITDYEVQNLGNE